MMNLGNKPNFLHIYLPVLFLSITGCTSNHVVYVQETTMGLTFGVGPEQTQKISLGYDRDLLAIVPKKGEDSSDAMSVFAIHKAKIASYNELEISEFVATGDPASKLASQPQAVSELRKKIYGE